MATFRLPNVDELEQSAPDAPKTARIDVTGLSPKQIEKVRNAPPGTEMDVLRNIHVPESFAQIVSKQQKVFELKDTKLNRAIYAAVKGRGFKSGPGKWAMINYAAVPDTILADIVSKKTPSARKNLLKTLPEKRLERIQKALLETRKTEKTKTDVNRAIASILSNQPAYKRRAKHEAEKRKKEREVKKATRAAKKKSKEPKA